LGADVTKNKITDIKKEQLCTLALAILSMTTKTIFAVLVILSMITRTIYVQLAIRFMTQKVTYAHLAIPSMTAKVIFAPTEIPSTIVADTYVQVITVNISTCQSLWTT
jgi:hypothetical protein